MKRIRKLTNWLISKLKSCPHKHTERRILAHYVTVEVTALFCAECGKQLTKEEWNV